MAHKPAFAGQGLIGWLIPGLAPWAIICRPPARARIRAQGARRTIPCACSGLHSDARYAGFSSGKVVFVSWHCLSPKDGRHRRCSAAVAVGRLRKCSPRFQPPGDAPPRTIHRNPLPGVFRPRRYPPHAASMRSCLKRSSARSLLPRQQRHPPAPGTGAGRAGNSNRCALIIPRACLPPQCGPCAAR